jgi:hypothetical protein
MRMTDLRVGWAVLGNDDRRVGIIKAVGQNYILTSRPGFAGDLYVPVSSVANVTSGAVHLNITARDAEQMGWEQQPRDEEEFEAGSDTDPQRHI